MNEELVALLILLLAVPVLWGLMWRGWRGRRRRQEDLPPLPAVPAAVPDAVLGDPGGIEAVYVTTTHAGRFLDRVVAHGLGVRSNALVRVTRRGVLLNREGAPDVWIPSGALLTVRRQRGMAGKFVDREGLVVLTWQHGDVPLDTGLRTRRAADRERLVEAASALLEPSR